MRDWCAAFPCSFAEHLSEDVEETGDNDRVSCKFIELRIGYLMRTTVGLYDVREHPSDGNILAE